jgi:hypothetical protein
LMPGHTLAAFQNPTYQNIIRNSAKWLIKR